MPEDLGGDGGAALPVWGCEAAAASVAAPPSSSNVVFADRAADADRLSGPRVLSSSAVSARPSIVRGGRMASPAPRLARNR